ncbi:MAG: hypothetical protein K2K85_03750 [Clostridia bacterium]|nr:hypothetical protein [Clostridia bacterium]
MAKKKFGGKMRPARILLARTGRFVDLSRSKEDLWQEVIDGNESNANSGVSKQGIKIERVRKLVDKKHKDVKKKKARARLADRLKKVAQKKQKASLDAKQKIANLVQRFRNGERIDLETEIMEFDSRPQKALKELIGENLDLKTLSLHLDELKHMENDHGENGTSNRDMRDIKDYQDIIDIITDFDEPPKLGLDKKGNIDLSKKYMDKDNKPSPKVAFKKSINGVKRLAILAISNNKKKRARLITSYKGNKK